MSQSVPLPWQPPNALAPAGVPHHLISPQRLTAAVADYLAPAVQALHGHPDLVDLADQLATFRTRLVALAGR